MEKGIRGKNIFNVQHVRHDIICSRIYIFYQIREKFILIYETYNKILLQKTFPLRKLIANIGHLI